VDGVAVLGLGKWCLVIGPAEAVSPVTDPVGPGDKQLAPPPAAHLVLGVAVEHVDTVHRVGAKTGTDLGDHGALCAARYLDLSARRLHL
jgi:hypothetical protein